MRVFKFTTGHVIYKPAYNYKFQLKITWFMNVKIIQKNGKGR